MSPPVSPSVVAAIFMIQNTSVIWGSLVAVRLAVSFSDISVISLSAGAAKSPSERACASADA